MGHEGCRFAGFRRGDGPTASGSRDAGRTTRQFSAGRMRQTRNAIGRRTTGSVFLYAELYLPGRAKLSDGSERDVAS